MGIRSYLEQEELDKKIEEITPLRAGFDLIREHVAITDAAGNILYLNKAAEQHTGYTFEESVGKNPGDLWGGHMPQHFYEDMWKTIHTDKRYWKGDVQNRRKDGTEYWQEVHINPVLDDAGEISCFIAVEPDITERKKAEDQIAWERDRTFNLLVSRELTMAALKKQLIELTAKSAA